MVLAGVSARRILERPTLLFLTPRGEELGRLTETPTPTIDTVLALVSLRARMAGLYGQG